MTLVLGQIMLVRHCRIGVMVLEQISSVLTPEKSSEGTEAASQALRREFELAGGLVALGLAAKFAPTILPKLTSRLAPAFSQAGELAAPLEQKALNAGEGKLFGVGHSMKELAAPEHLLPVVKKSPVFEATNKRADLPSFSWVGT